MLTQEDRQMNVLGIGSQLNLPVPPFPQKKAYYSFGSINAIA